MPNITSSKRVLVTRQSDQSEKIAELIIRNGHQAFLLPMIETTQKTPIIKDLKYDVMIITSPNTCRYFSPYISKVKADIYIAVGKSTMQAMDKYLNITADKTPSVQSIDGVKNILRTLDLENKKIIMPGAKVRVEFDDSEFISCGATFFYPIVYETVFTKHEKNQIETFLEKNQIDTITFCSPSAARSFITQTEIDHKRFRYIAIGKTTADYLSSVGIVSEYPERFTVEDMIEII